MAVAQDLVSSVPMELANNLSFLVNILQALGIAILLYIIFSTINIILSRKKEKEIKKISENLEIIKRLLVSKSKKHR
jgi:mannose/fructose/N-acetylgalactosamine-specific phosphotransferase system component IIC